MASQLVQIGDFNFRFECQPGCTECCTHPGDVHLTPGDVTRIAAYLGIAEAEFRRRYCAQDEGGLRLANPHKPCIFVREGGCSIHEVKPLQCRTFPFWPENVKNKRSWKALRRYCPGVGAGPILPRDFVRAEAQACRDEGIED